MSKIKVLVLNDLELKEKEIDNSLKALQNEVGGYIEIPSFSRKLSENNIDMIINEEGKVNRLQPQLAIYQDNKIIDVICGNIIFTSTPLLAASTSTEPSNTLKDLCTSIVKSTCPGVSIIFNL